MIMETLRKMYEDSCDNNRAKMITVDEIGTVIVCERS